MTKIVEARVREKFDPCGNRIWELVLWLSNKEEGRGALPPKPPTGESEALDSRSKKEKRGHGRFLEHGGQESQGTKDFNGTELRKREAKHGFEPWTHGNGGTPKKEGKVAPISIGDGGKKSPNVRANLKRALKFLDENKKWISKIVMDAIKIF